MAEKIIKSNLSIGIGCKRNTTETELLNALKTTLESNQLSMKDIDTISSIDLKQDEKGLIDLAQTLGKSVVFYSSEELSEISTPNRSSYVKKITGTFSVAEASAILSSVNRTLIVPKQKYKNITVAVAI